MCIDSYADISIHTPTRGTTAGTGTATNLAEFQSTFPREERPYYTIVRIQVLQFQSTLPREERPFPTDFVTAFMPYFNPRSHERSDCDNFRLAMWQIISIHAPTRGATHMPWQHMHSLLFQSTLPREERHMTVQLHPHRRRFQSTLPREERPSLYLLGAHLHNFNPRSHERSDSQQSELITMLRISIHAPTRGATQVVVARVIYRFNFNPRSHERSDRQNIVKITIIMISIHAPTRGAT